MSPQESPQKENGFTPIAHKLLEAFYQCKLLEYERVIMLCIWRKTYGWNKKVDWISNSQFYEETGIAKPNITRTLKRLREKKIVVKDCKKTSINKNYWMWEVEWRVISPDNKVISPDNKKLSHQIPTKEKKETIQKKLAKTSFAGKKNIMSFNKKGEDYDEGVIDMDGDMTLVEEKKPQTKKYPNAPEVRKLFQEILGKNPLDWKKNTTILQACENLYTERGITKMRNALEWYKEHKDTEYCPVIDSPLDLDRKYTNLSRFKTKYEN